MSSFEDALEDMSSLLRCPLCKNQLKSTVTVKECGHHFCEECIYPILGTLCKCPTCSIPARVGNLLKNPSYDILVACTTKLSTLRVSHISEYTPLSKDSILESQSQEGENGTPIGSPVWTFDCGPTFSNSLPFSSSSSNVDEQTFPSLNTAMISHDRERVIRQRDLKQESTSILQTNVEGDHHSRVAEDGLDDHQQSKPPPSSGNPPIPTFSQLQRLLSIRRDPSVAPTITQENAAPTQYLTFTDELSQSKDKEASGFVTPRMPSPSLGAIESFATTYQPPYGFTTQGDASQPQARLSKKRRMQSEAESTGRSDVTKNKSSKLRSGRDTSPSDLQTLVEDDVSSRKAKSSKVPQGRLEQDTFTAILPIEDGDGTDASSEEREVAQIVESSQPSLDVTMLSLRPNSGGLGRKAQRARRSQESTLNATPLHLDHTPLNDGDITQQQVITCIFTGLNKEQRESFDQNITRVIGAGLLMEHIQDQPFSESTTHIITNADANVLKQEGVALCPRVLKYLHGMLSGPWILSHDWFVDSIDAGTWLPLPQPNYMIQGDTQYGPAPGTRIRREIRIRKSMKLFNSCRMFFYGNFGGPGQKSITKDELLRLVRDGGAETWQRRPASKPLSSSGSRNATADEGSLNQDFFAPSRSFLYVTEDTKPWEVPIDRTAPIIICDPGSIPSGSIKKGEGGQAGSTKALTQADLKKHGWLRDYQAVSLMWLLNCISCSIMGAQDIELLYGSKDDVSLSDESPIAEEEIRKLSQAWTRWRNRD